MVRVSHNSDDDGNLLVAIGVSAGLHVVVVLLVVLGLPIFWEPEVLPGAIGIELAKVSDITAAPVPQQLGKPKEQPKPEPPKPEVKKEAPKKEAPPPPAPPKPAAAPPPPAPPEEVAAVIPDPQAEKKEEEKKKKEEEKKKKEEEKKRKAEEEKKRKEAEKQRKAEDEQFQDLMDLMNKEAAPETDKKPDKKANAEPAEPVTGEQTAIASPVRLTASQEDGYKRQLIPEWNYDAGIANPENYGVWVRIDLAPDGTVLRSEILDKSRMGDPVFRAVAEKARIAPLKLGRFEGQSGEQHPPQIDIYFDLAKAINGGF